jgi:RNA polymerase sigma-70 factor (ECF subfamily)
MHPALLMPIDLARPVALAATPSVEQIYRAHAGDVTRWISRLGGPGVDLEDLTQEVFELVQKHLPSYRGEALLTTWLFQISANVVRAHRRRDRWRSFFGRAHDVAAGSTGEVAASADEQIAKREARELVYAALDRLKERYRTAIILFELEDLPGEQVAELMGVSTANVWVLLHRARAELIKEIKAIRGEGEA